MINARRRSGRALAAAAAVALATAAGAGTEAVAAGGSHKHGTPAAAKSKKTILSRQVVRINGRRTVITTFRKNGRTYRTKTWTTRVNGRVRYHSLTFLIRGKKKKAAAKTAAPSVTASPEVRRSCTPGQQAAMQTAFGAFWTHFQAAHLETSPGGQATEILASPDNYVKIHTVLVENMLAGGVSSADELPPALYALYKAFEDHFVAAHLRLSPMQQVQDLTSDPDGYVLLHTALFNNMLAPLLAWADKFSRGTEEVCKEETVSPAPSSPGTTAPVQIDIQGSKFPAETRVAPGTKVTWTNLDDVPHTVTSMHGGPLRSGNFGKGESYSYTFADTGTFMYLCDVHPDMQSQVVVG